jgi:hypothetical protein
MIARLQIAFDCENPIRLAEFYSKILGYRQEGAPSGFSTIEAFYEARGVPKEEWDDGRAIVDPSGSKPRIWFHKMDTPKPGKNRLHLDLYVGNAPRAKLAERKAKVDPEVQKVVALGATISEGVVDGDYYFVTCLDPEGNEFDIA